MKHIRDDGPDHAGSKISIAPVAVFIGIVLAICAIRGIVLALVFHQSFLRGFMYPVAVISLAALSILPFYIAQKLIATAGDPPPYSMKLWQILVLIPAMIACVIALLFASAMTADRIFTLLLGNDRPIIVVSNFWWLSLIPVIYLPMLVLYFFIPCGIAGKLSAYSLPRRKKVPMFTCALLICLTLTLPIYFSYYTITTDGISTRTGFSVSDHPWSEVNEAVVSARSDVLTVELHMENGRKFRLMSDAEYNNDRFDEAYPGGNEDFTAEVLGRLTEQGTPVTEQEDIESKLEYDYWIEYLDRIRAIYK